MKFYLGLIFLFFVGNNCFSQSEADTIVLQDIEWDKTSPARQIELTIPSDKTLIQGFMYKANGKQKHPALILLHGYPGNERNLDLAQVVRAHGWNVLYFNYRGSWGSQGSFSFEHCVQDVVNVVSFLKTYQDSLQVDTSNIVLFGHSMGGWICLKALQQLPIVKKGFALSTWDIYRGLKNIHSETELAATAKMAGEYFVLNTPAKDIFKAVIKAPEYYNLIADPTGLSDKQIIMLDEHSFNTQLAGKIREENKSYFDYQVWQTDHPFTNKRVALIKMVLAFLDK